MARDSQIFWLDPPLHWTIVHTYYTSQFTLDCIQKRIPTQYEGHITTWPSIKVKGLHHPCFWKLLYAAKTCDVLYH